jgi:hypothetical protein
MKLSEPGSRRPRIWRLCSSVQRRTKKLVYTQMSSRKQDAPPNQTWRHLHNENKGIGMSKRLSYFQA